MFGSGNLFKVFGSAFAGAASIALVQFVFVYVVEDLWDDNFLAVNLGLTAVGLLSFLFPVFLRRRTIAVQIRKLGARVRKLTQRIRALSSPAPVVTSADAEDGATFSPLSHDQQILTQNHQ